MNIQGVLLYRCLLILGLYGFSGIVKPGIVDIAQARPSAPVESQIPSGPIRFNLAESGTPLAEVIEVYKVDGAKIGGLAPLWARVKNSSSTALPADALILFYIYGPGLSPSLYYSVSIPKDDLAPGADKWYKFDWQIPSTAPAGKYGYLAAAYAGGIYSRFAGPQEFDVNGPPGKPVLTAPAGVISAILPTYSWNAVPTATWYLLWINDKTSSGKIVQWFTASEIGCESGTGTCSITPSTSLAAGAATWWVQAWNSYGTGLWSDGMAFTVVVGVPGKATLVTPAGTISTASPVYTWNAVSNTAQYYLWVADTSNSEKIKAWYKADEAGCASGTGTCSVTPATALVAGACQWWIQTWNSYGTGPWSDAMSFTLVSIGPPGKATLVSPTGTITATSPDFTWKPVTGATSYTLFVSDSATSGKINKTYATTDAGCDSGTANCVAKPGVVLAGGAAQWWIQASNGYGSGPWSDAMSFSVGSSIVGPHGIEFIAVASGEFQMGSSNNLSNEQPVHRVVIAKSFELGKFEITQGQWNAVMSSNPSYFTGDDTLPVETVSLSDVQAFLTKLNAANDGYTYRLPTEAEWEYACRAGTTGDYAGTPDEMGWYASNATNKTHPVGKKKPNAWGLYDTQGNVWEWVQDWYGAYPTGSVTDPQGPTSGTFRVFRGGSWLSDAADLRSAARGAWYPDYVNTDLGLRILRTKP